MCRFCEIAKIMESCDSGCVSFHYNSPLLVASCIGEGWYTRLWGCAPFSKRISVHATLPTVQALNRGVAPSIVRALTCKHKVFLAFIFRPNLIGEHPWDF